MYSIGHGSRRWDDFAVLLRQYGIKYLIDVRSIPVSRFHSQYNRAAMDAALADVGIQYVFMGDSLGGRPKDKSLYDANGKVSYGAICATESYQAGISRLVKAIEKGVPAAIMCSERNP